MEGRVWSRGDDRFDYLFYEPADRQPGEKLPMLVFLHGAGERDGDVHVMECHSVPKIFSGRHDYRCICICPQCKGDDIWDMHLKQLAQFIREMTVLYNADPARVSLTGLSMGGYGTWELGTSFPELFSAIAPICGGGMNWRAAKLANGPYSVPVRCFHGDADTAVPWICDKIMVDAVNAAGGHAELTLCPGVGHDAWVPAYEHSDLIAWLIAQKRS